MVQVFSYPYESDTSGERDTTGRLEPSPDLHQLFEALIQIDSQRNNPFHCRAVGLGPWLTQLASREACGRTRQNFRSINSHCLLIRLPPGHHLFVMDGLRMPNPNSRCMRAMRFQVSHNDHCALLDESGDYGLLSQLPLGVTTLNPFSTRGSER